MLIPAKITNKYEIMRNTAVRTVRIAIRGPVELGPGDVIVLNPRKPGLIEIKRVPMLSPVLPYPDN